jgi:protein transport protein SEC31
MDNGTVAIYNPSSIISKSNNGDVGSNSDSALLSTIERNKKGAITATQFNPHSSSSSLLATGSSMGEILITSLENPLLPTSLPPIDGSSGASTNLQQQQSGSTGNGAGITSLAWNIEVEHILATSNGNGVATIWDMKQNKPWCELQCDVSGSALSCVQWNPSQGMHLMTCSSDDRHPVIKLWDLRYSKTEPLATSEGVEGGHVKGILDMDWCPFDESLLVTCGKDDRTLLWDLITFKPISEIRNDENTSDSSIGNGTYGGNEQNLSGLGGISEVPPSPTSSGFGVGFTTSQQKRYDVKFSHVRRGLLSTCSFDRKVQAHSILGIATKCGRPPKWMKPASGVSFGFGGSITSFASTHKKVSISSHVERPDLKAAVQDFESAIADGNYAAFSAMKQESESDLGNSYEAQVWGFMQVIFDENARAKLLYFLGFDPEKIHKVASEFVEEKKSTEIDMSKLSMNDVKRCSPPMSDEAENTVNQALLVGNFEAAVECCMRSGNLADALILASCGGAELWAKTQAQYFASELKKRSFLSVVSAVIHNKVSLINYCTILHTAKVILLILYV